MPFRHGASIGRGPKPIDHKLIATHLWAVEVRQFMRCEDCKVLTPSSNDQLEIGPSHIWRRQYRFETTIVMQRAEYRWIHSANGPNDNVNKLMALARKLFGTPKNLQLIDGDSDVFGDGSVTLVATPGHTPGHQSLLVHLENSGFIILSGDVAHSAENFEKNIVPSLNTNEQESVASMEKVGQLIAAYKATLFIKIAPCILRLRFADWASNATVRVLCKRQLFTVARQY